jgi:leucyl aminopeptidase
VCLLGKPEWREPEIRDLIDRTAGVERAIAWARDLVNTPAGDLTPEELARRAQEMATDRRLSVRIWDESDLREGGFAGILGVGAGSRHPPRMIELRYEPPAGAWRELIGLAGKGVTFDAGGLALKKPKDMLGMKSDMAGAAAVLATMRVVAEQAPRDVAVVAVIPAAENMPGGSAMRPGDVLRYRNGVTAEVVDPDAEGRLLLADALIHLAGSRPAAIVDVATLTYSTVAALGEEITAGVGNDRALLESIVAAGEAVGEPIWELPLWRRYRSQLDSHVADLRNDGKEDVAGVIVAALFLEEFVGGIPWVHLDIGGTAFLDEPRDGMAAGGTGVPTRTLIRLVSKGSGTTTAIATERVGDTGSEET